MSQQHVYCIESEHYERNPKLVCLNERPLELKSNNFVPKANYEAPEIVDNCYSCESQQVSESIQPEAASKPDSALDATLLGAHFVNVTRVEASGCFVCGSKVACSKGRRGQIRCRPCRYFKYKREKRRQIPTRESCRGEFVKGQCRITEQNRSCSYCRYVRCCAGAERQKRKRGRGRKREGGDVAKSATSWLDLRGASAANTNQLAAVEPEGRCCICGSSKSIQLPKNGLVHCFSCRVFMGLRKKRNPYELNLNCCLGEVLGHCIISENNRKCTYCRYQKGIALEAYMIEANLAQQEATRSECFVCGSDKLTFVRFEIRTLICRACYTFWRRRIDETEYTINNCIGLTEKGSCALRYQQHLCLYCRFQKLVLAKRLFEGCSLPQPQYEIEAKKSLPREIEGQHVGVLSLRNTPARDQLAESNSNSSAGTFIRGDSDLPDSHVPSETFGAELRPRPHKTRKVFVGNLVLCLSENEVHLNTVVGKSQASQVYGDKLDPPTAISCRTLKLGQEHERGQAQQQGDEVRRQFTQQVVEKTRQVVIDERPVLEQMLKRGSNNSADLRDSPPTEESLIGPAEDCEDRDEIEIVEIDCDFSSTLNEQLSL